MELLGSEFVLTSAVDEAEFLVRQSLSELHLPLRTDNDPGVDCDLLRSGKIRLPAHRRLTLDLVDLKLLDFEVLLAGEVDDRPRVGGERLSQIAREPVAAVVDREAESGDEMVFVAQDLCLTFRQAKFLDDAIGESKCERVSTLAPELADCGVPWDVGVHPEDAPAQWLNDRQGRCNAVAVLVEFARPELLLGASEQEACTYKIRNRASDLVELLFCQIKLCF